LPLFEPCTDQRSNRKTNKPFGLNFLTFDTREDSFAAALELRPAVMQFAWGRHAELGSCGRQEVNRLASDDF
jgi:hypothetical protein